MQTVRDHHSRKLADAHGEGPELFTSFINMEENKHGRYRPDLSGVVIGHLEKDKYYNCLGLSDADGYEWIQIAEDQYCARVSSVDLLPAALILAAGDRLVIDRYDSKTITFRIERK